MGTNRERETVHVGGLPPGRSREPREILVVNDTAPPVVTREVVELEVDTDREDKTATDRQS